MGHDDDRHPVRVKTIDQRDNLVAGGLIELAGGFIGEQQPWPVGEGPRNRHALHLAAGKLRRTMAGAGRQADIVEQFAGSCAPLGTAGAGFCLGKLDVFPGRQHRQQKEALKHESDFAQPQAAAIGIGHRSNVAIPEQHVSAGRNVDDTQHVQKRGLPASRRTDDADVVSGIDAQRHVVQGCDGTSRHREDPGDVPRFDNRGVHETTSRRSVAAIGSRDTIRIG